MYAMIGQTGKSVNPNRMSALRRPFSSLSDFLIRERGRILLFVAILLIGAIAFQAGFLQGSSVSARPVIVEVSGHPVCPDPAADASGKPSTTVSGVPDPASCAFVGSRNSTLYHLPTCGTAKRIKPENIVCFGSAEEAQAKGYRAGCVQ